MHTLVVYFSRFGNTQEIAETIARSMSNDGHVRTMELRELEVDEMKDIDLLVIGSPTHNMNLPKAVKPLLERIPKGTLQGIPAAVFDTSYKMSWLLNQFTASKRLASKMRKKGAKIVAPPEIFQVTEREGPLYEGELDRAQAWAKSLRQKIGKQS